LLLVAVLAYSSARAGLPFVTNDPDPPEVGQWEINLPWTLKRSQDRSLSGEIITFDPNYGYDRFTQLSIELPVPYSGPEEGGFSTGIGDVLLEYKRRFGTDPYAGYFGINPQLTLPTGDKERGLGAGRGTVQIPLLYQKKWGETVFYSDLRYKWRAGEEGKGFWFLGFAVEQQISAGLKLGAEVFGTTPQASGGNHNASFNVGFKYSLAPGQVLMISAGRSFRPDPDLTLFLGLKFLMPP
jgi:hypothetical protein